MKEKVKDLWVEALRSGKYEQTTGFLKKGNGYCCLGVLCDVYAKTQKKKGFQKSSSQLYHLKNVYNFDNKRAGLPDRVIKWAGINANGKIIISENSEIISQNNTISYLMMLNDRDGKTFDEIATFVEKNWREI